VHQLELEAHAELVEQVAAQQVQEIKQQQELPIQVVEVVELVVILYKYMGQLVDQEL
jgi:hypothetical protein